ncbi:hypothetical protein PWT90_09489 [Aphanocladium album]|nr:hypothetical protein PWT90_09489 [Aphanocladium album]
MVAAQRGVPVRRGGSHGFEHLWRRLFSYMALTLGNLNQQLAARVLAQSVLMQTIDLLSNEQFIMDSLRRCHLNGFLAIVALPEQDQVDGKCGWSEEQIHTIYKSTFPTYVSSPPLLTLALHRINRLRVLARGTAQSVHRFVPVTWTETYPLPREILKNLLATIYNVVVILCAVLFLPPSLAQPFADVHRVEAIADPAEAARLHYRRIFLATLRQMTDRMSISRLGWIFAVVDTVSVDATVEVKANILALQATGHELAMILTLTDTG